LTWSYSGNPAASDLDAVRFYVGDTNTSRQLLQDEEVNFTIAEHGNLRMAAAVCADALAALFAREADQRVGDISKSLSQVSKAFERLATKLRKEAGKRAGVSFPATSIDWKDSRGEETDLVQPEFPIALGDNIWAVQLNDTLTRINWRGW
jgi:hypothetical protein